MLSSISQRAGSVSLRFFIAAALVFLYLPIFVVVLFSFNDSSGLSFPIQGLSVRWYTTVFTDPIYTSALANSLLVATSAALITAVLGTMAAFGLEFVPPRLRVALGVLFLAPIALPGLFIGLALLVLLSQTGVTPSLVTVTAAHVLFTFPFFVLVTRAALDRFDPRFHELGADLGAGPVQRFRRITLPMVGPILAAATVLAFALSFDEFIITSFVIGPTNTVPLVIWSSMHRSIDPTVNALASVLLAVTILATTLTAVLLHALRRHSRQGTTR